MFLRWPSRIGLYVVITATIAALIILHATKSDNPEMFKAMKLILPGGLCKCQSSSNFMCSECLDCANNDLWNMKVNKTVSLEPDTWKFTYGRDDTNEGLSQAQCAASFPGLFEDVNRAVKLRRDNHITREDLDAIKIQSANPLARRRMVRAKIYDGELYVLASEFWKESDRRRGLSILHSISRSMMAIPDRCRQPNIEFVFSLDDLGSKGTQPLWVLTRRPQDQNVWLMPDFGFWSSSVEGTGPLNSVVSDIVESEAPFAEKEPKIFWSGRLHFLPKLRRALVDTAKGKPWSAIRAIYKADPHSRKDNFVTAADQCNYMFLAHAEGRSYSGSLKYRQLCRSVIVSHKLQWIQHHHYLMVANGTQQNFVEVERDFSDLDATMEHLLANPDEAKRIADNNVRTFRERYLTPAAEACYWRELIRGWGSVSFPVELYERDADGDSKQSGKRKLGVRFESYVLFESDKQMSWLYTRNRPSRDPAK